MILVLKCSGRRKQKNIYVELDNQKENYQNIRRTRTRQTNTMKTKKKQPEGLQFTYETWKHSTPNFNKTTG